MIFADLPIFIVFCAVIYLTIIYGLLKIIEVVQQRNPLGDRSPDIDRLKMP